MFKQELRELMKEKRASASNNQECAQRVLENFIGQNFNFESLMLYSSTGTELTTKPFFDYFKDKSLFLPRVEKNDLVCVKFEDKLTLNKYNVLEPIGQAVPKSAVDICIMPGLAFSKGFVRLGYGKGFYDRFLRDFKGIKIGICFDFQIVESIKCDAFDVKMDIIISDKRLLRQN